MDSSWRVPAAHKNEKAYEQKQQANSAEVILCGERFFCWSGYERCFKLFPVAQEFIGNLRPEPGMIQPSSHLSGS